jgi:hypothetical protein
MSIWSNQACCRMNEGYNASCCNHMQQAVRRRDGARQHERHTRHAPRAPCSPCKSTPHALPGTSALPNAGSTQPSVHGNVAPRTYASPTFSLSTDPVLARLSDTSSAGGGGGVSHSRGPHTIQRASYPAVRPCTCSLAGCAQSTLVVTQDPADWYAPRVQQ